MGRKTAQPLNRFVFCVVVVEFAVNGNQALKSKSCQNQFVTKITCELVLINLIDLQMFSKQVVHGKGK